VLVLENLMGLCRNYFWATATIYGRAWLSRVARTLYTTGLGLPRTIELGGPNVPSASPLLAPSRYQASTSSSACSASACAR
jgi:hypothetical protein